MKRYGFLYDKVADRNNLYSAIINASKGKRKRRNVQKVLIDIDNKVDELEYLLKTKSFKVHPYKIKKIFDTNRQKEREICVPAFFPDQCVHWAVMQIIEPIFRKRMYEYSCASVKGGGVHKAMKYLKRATQCDKRNTKWCLQLDIRKYYPSVQNDVLKGKLRRVFKDEDLLWLLDTIIDSHKGLPIGNYTSQWLANFYLDELDKFIKENSTYYVRYMDDMIIFSSNKNDLHKLKVEIEERLKQEKLSIKPNWQIYSINYRPIDFLGFKFYRYKIILRKRILLKLKRKVRLILKRGYVSLRNARALMSYYGWLIHTNSHFIFENIKTLIYKCRKAISNEDRKQRQTNGILPVF